VGARSGSRAISSGQRDPDACGVTSGLGVKQTKIIFSANDSPSTNRPTFPYGGERSWLIAQSNFCDFDGFSMYDCCGWSEAAMTHQFVLVSARKGGGAGQSDKEDYDVRLGNTSGPIVGCIWLHPQAPGAAPWFWTITAKERKPSIQDGGYSATRAQAMADFEARWSLA